MIETMIDEWKDVTGEVSYVWSVWRDGKRVMQGDAHDSAAEAADAARDFCVRRLGAEPDEVTHL